MQKPISLFSQQGDNVSTVPRSRAESTTKKDPIDNGGLRAHSSSPKEASLEMSRGQFAAWNRPLSYRQSRPQRPTSKGEKGVGKKYTFFTVDSRGSK